MRFKKKQFIGKLLLLVACLVLSLWFFRSDFKASYTNTDSFRSFGVNLFRFNELSETLTWTTKQCVSSANKIKVTADFTTNDVLDHMTITKMQNNYVKGILDTNITTFQHNKASSAIESDPLEVIVIPHSHNDPGWKKTYMEYFEDSTTHILTNIVNKLTQYPDMTFIWVESCFLDVWWRNQTQGTKARFVALVKSKRLEIVSGMWVAPDEASPHYFQILDQMIEGHYWIKKNIGVVPESSLNFDQFGYSNSVPYLVKKAGIKNVLIKRIHRAVKEMFGEKNWMTFKWRQFWDPEGRDDIQGHVDTYEWMAISDSCGPDRPVCRGLDFTIQPDLPRPGTAAANLPVRMDTYSTKIAANLHMFVQLLVNQFKLKAKNYKQNIIMLPHGGDFHYAKAIDWDKQYRNMKIFIDYVNDHVKDFNVRMRFGTLKDYYDKLEEQTESYNLNYPVISGDFFTYTESDEYWTGYFTTRMFDKRLGRELLESLRAAELFSSVVLHSDVAVPNDVKREMVERLVTARQDLGVFMHHDAITGTSRQHVVNDYEKRLSEGLTSTQDVLATAVEYLIHNGSFTGGSEKVVQSGLLRTAEDKLTRRSIIRVTDSGTKVILMNSLTQSRREIVTLTLDTTNAIILDHRGERIDFDSSVIDGRKHVMFEVRFPPVSFLIYTIKKTTEDASDRRKHVVKSMPIKKGYFTCDNSYMNVSFSESDGSPTGICYKSENYCTKFDIDWRYYSGHGGAYTMLSHGTENKAYKHKVNVTPLTGNTFCGAVFTFDFFTVTYKLLKTKAVTARALRIELTSDLTNKPDFRGDLAMRFNTKIKTEFNFYVDSNGLQLLKRKFRKNIPFDGNVYPMTSMAVLQDDETRLILHSAQPHGVVSRSSGQLDVMVDRIAPRPEMDLPEGALDSKPTKVLFFLEFESRVNVEKVIEEEETILPAINSVFLNDILQHPIYAFYSPTGLSPSKSVHSFLKQKVPCDVIVANIKNLAYGTDKLDGVSLTLFRRGIACNIKQSTEAFCPLFEPVNLKPGQLIGQHNSDVMNTKEMYLSHLMEKGDVTSDDTIYIRPMDIKTFHLTRKKSFSDNRNIHRNNG